MLAAGELDGTPARSDLSVVGGTVDVGVESGAFRIHSGPNCSAVVDMFGYGRVRGARVSLFASQADAMALTCKMIFHGLL